MKYIVSEEELKALFFNLDFGKDIPAEVIENDYQDFLKSKQPVELVAEGELAETLAELIVPFNEHENDNIKIYIEKMKE